MSTTRHRERTASACVLFFLTVIIFTTCIGRSAAFADERIALVIGNGQYVHTDRLPRLPNSANDAADIATVLQRIGFKVIVGIDLDRETMVARIMEFQSKLNSARLALFFYAGHGVQDSGRNFLIPIDARLPGTEYLKFQAIDIQIILDQMETFDRTNLVFLDACRNNPLAANARSGARGGLALIQSGIGTFIAFSTQPNNVALDGEGRNSPFTAALLKHIPKPGIDISEILRDVRRDVLAATNKKQVPWDHSSLTGRVVLVPAAMGSGDPAPQPALKPGTEVRLPQELQPSSSPIPTRLDLASECDELTAYRSDPDLPPSNKWQDDYAGIDVAKALRICQRAVDDARDTRTARRMILQLGRAIAAQGRSEAMSGNQPAARKSFERAAELWTKAAGMNSGQALNVLGSYVQGSFNMATPQGPFVVKAPDYKSAFQHYQRAADLGNPNGLTNAGIALIGLDDRFGIPVDYRKAKLYLEQARKLNLSGAYYGIGRSKMLGMGYEKNEAEGLRYVSVAYCKKHGQARAFFDRGSHPRPNCVGEDFVDNAVTARVNQSVAPLANISGDLCDKLAANPTDRRKPVAVEGVAYGSLREQAEQAINACEAAVRQTASEPRYQYQLGRALQFRDRSRAFDIHRRLVSQGYAAAHDNLGWLYLSEHSNPAEAVRQFAAGARQEDPDSMVSLGEMITRGYFNPPDPAGAKLMLFKRAAELGHPSAGRAYELEIGLVEQSRNRVANQRELQRQMSQFFGAVLGNLARQ